MEESFSNSESETETETESQSPTYLLSRLNVTGDLDDPNIPLVVLNEIAKCHGIPPININSETVQQFHERVVNNPIGRINYPPSTPEDYPKLVRYINPDEEWSERGLLKAFTHLQNWCLSNPFPMAPSNFTYGMQTQSDPNRLNACVMYRICKYHSVVLHQSHTYYHMACLVQAVQQTGDYIRSALYTQMVYIDRPELLEMYSYGFTAINDTFITNPESGSPNTLNNYDALASAYKTINDTATLQLRISPVSYAEAITLSAINFCVDISWADDCIKEYNRLKENPDDWVPTDPKLLEIYNTNIHLLDLEITFNPLLPAELYTEKTLQQMALIEGYTIDQLRQESSYSLMQTASISHTFYYGLQDGIMNTETAIYKYKVSEIPKTNVVCYGFKGLMVGMAMFTALRMDELAGLFKTAKNFNNPLFEGDTFSELAIKKLKTICKDFYIDESKESIAEKGELYDAIIIAELFTNSANSKARELREIYDQADEAKKEGIKGAINNLFVFAMYMRGWLGEGEYPIENASVDNQCQVDILVTKGIADFTASCESLAETGNVIMNMPLLAFRSTEFHTVTLNRMPETIGSRLEVVVAGEQYENYASCIRLSSNLFGATAYRYMEVLGIPRPFSIESLRSIS